MKIIGLIGGLSWESTAIYYRLLNETVKQRLGGLHSARILLWSFDFDDIAKLQAAGDWQAATAKMVEAAHALKLAGAEMLVICSNTMHQMAKDLESQLPVLHIADATAFAIRQKGLQKVGLLATRFTMEQDFYTARLKNKFDINALVPDEVGRGEVHRIIYDELCKGIIQPSSKEVYKKIIAQLIQNGAQGIILGCTEIGLLIEQADVPVPVFDTTQLHALAAVDWALN